MTRRPRCAHGAPRRATKSSDSRSNLPRRCPGRHRSARSPGQGAGLVCRTHRAMRCMCAWPRPAHGGSRACVTIVPRGDATHRVRHGGRAAPRSGPRLRRGDDRWARCGAALRSLLVGECTALPANCGRARGLPIHRSRRVPPPGIDACVLEILRCDFFARCSVSASGAEPRAALQPQRSLACPRRAA
jgi:hypothetical protein